eukprot:TRINITY_DN1259_c0_g1_i1.p1 TRINITY_DN1259_c0_g1~~TRINITY_DN1259_c0_g1_i1.p1  ORF type:complete len:533 (+),score=9.71 TRINITY_DN1259_c0_g1_i1:327-1925(+)
MKSRITSQFIACFNFLLLPAFTSASLSFLPSYHASSLESTSAPSTSASHSLLSARIVLPAVGSIVDSDPVSSSGIGLDSGSVIEQASDFGANSGSKSSSLPLTGQIPREKSIISALLESEYAYFIHLLDVCGLLDKLESEIIPFNPEITILAVPDASILDNVPNNVLQFLQLPSSLKILQTVLSHHIIRKRLYTDSWLLLPSQVSTCGTEPALVFRLGETLMVDDSHIIPTKVMSEHDGVIYELSTLMIPKDLFQLAYESPVVSSSLDRRSTLSRPYSEQISHSWKRARYLAEGPSSNSAAPAPSPTPAPAPSPGPSPSPPALYSSLTAALNGKSDYADFASFLASFDLFTTIQTEMSNGKFYTIFAVTNEVMVANGVNISKLDNPDTKKLLLTHVTVSDSVFYTYSELEALGAENARTPSTARNLATLDNSTLPVNTSDTNQVFVDGILVIEPDVVKARPDVYNATVQGVAALFLTPSFLNSIASPPPPPSPPPPTSAGEKAVVPATPLLLCLVTVAVLRLGTVVPRSITG